MCLFQWFLCILIRKYAVARLACPVTMAYICLFVPMVVCILIRKYAVARLACPVPVRAVSSPPALLEKVSFMLLLNVH